MSRAEAVRLLRKSGGFDDLDITALVVFAGLLLLFFHDFLVAVVAVVNFKRTTRESSLPRQR